VLHFLWWSYVVTWSLWSWFRSRSAITSVGSSRLWWSWSWSRRLWSTKRFSFSKHQGSEEKNR